MIENNKVDFKNDGINVGTNEGNDGVKVVLKNDFWVMKK